MTIALARESRTFVRGNAPGMRCRYSISATAGHAAQQFDNGVINNEDIDKALSNS